MSAKRGAWWRRCFLAALTGACANPNLALDPETAVEHAEEVADEAVDAVPARKRVADPRDGRQGKERA